MLDLRGPHESPEGTGTMLVDLPNCEFNKLLFFIGCPASSILLYREGDEYTIPYPLHIKNNQSKMNPYDHTFVMHCAGNEHNCILLLLLLLLFLRQDLIHSPNCPETQSLPALASKVLGL